MSHVLHSFQVCVVFLCFSSFIYSMQDDIADNSKDQQEVEQESQFCKLPLNVLYHIASCFCGKGYIIDGKQHIYTRWKEINNLALACKLLDRTVTVPNRKIQINCMMKRKWDPLSCSDFLSRVYNILERIVRRGGNNKIHLDLSINKLAEDVPVFESFIKKCVEFKCAAGLIVNQLTSLELGLNGFTELPEDITKLRVLKHLGIDENQLHSATIEQICTTMPFLESLGLDGCDLDGLPDSFKNLKLLRVLNVQGNLLTIKDLSILQKLSNLEELHIGPAFITFADILKTVAYLPKIKKLDVERNTESGDLASLEKYFETFPPLCPLAHQI